MQKKLTRYFDTLKEAEAIALDWSYNIDTAETRNDYFVYRKPSEDKTIIVTPHPKGFKMRVFDMNTTEND